MKLKDKALIEYFGKKNIDENTLASKNYTIRLDLFSHSDMNLNEVLSIVNQFPSAVQGVTVLTSDPEVVESLVQYLPSTVAVSLNMVSKKLFEGLKPEVSQKIASVTFNSKDRSVELINVGEIAKKFPNSNSVEYNCLLAEGVNVTDLHQIEYLLKKNSMINLTPELLKQYQEFAERNYGKIPDNMIVGSQMIYNRDVFNEWNQQYPDSYFLPGCALKDAQNYSLLNQANGKTVILFANSMTDISLDVAENLKKQGIECKIRMNAFDNATYQNEDYGLDEYIEMSRKMEELIGDIDENLPEEQKFRMIYERITKYLEYDYPAAYPKGKEEKKYSKEQVRNCRNLRNGLLFGKTVCAGYADILKNACLMKGIECEYVQGPVDSIQSKESYIMKKNVDREEVVYSDDQSVITRGYHAWNKVKINGEWYNCDPTWDRTDLVNGRAPKFALISDEVFKKLGRPTVEVLRHPCTKDVFGAEKNRFFSGLQPSGNLVASNKVLEFESTVDEYGRPRQLPVIPKVFPWTRMMIKLKKFAKEQQANMKAGIKRMAYNIQKKINPDFDKTEEMTEELEETTEKIPVVEDETEKIETIEDTEKLETIDDTEPMPPIYTEPLPVVGDTEPMFTVEDTEPIPVLDDTEPMPIGNISEKKPSWELSKSELSAVRAVEQKQQVNQKQNRDQSKNRGNEIGD